MLISKSVSQRCTLIKAQINVKLVRQWSMGMFTLAFWQFNIWKYKTWNLKIEIVKLEHSSLEFGTLNVQVSGFHSLNLEIQRMKLGHSKLKVWTFRSWNRIKSNQITKTMFFPWMNWWWQWNRLALCTFSAFHWFHRFYWFHWFHWIWSWFCHFILVQVKLFLLWMISYFF